MRLDRIDADVQPGGDLLIDVPLLNHSSLAVRQRACRGLALAAEELLEQRSE